MMHMRHRSRVVLFATLSSGAFTLALFACGATSSNNVSGADAAIATGSERGACFPNNTCNAGLVCLSQVCVNPDGGTTSQTDGSPGSEVDGTLPVDAGPEMEGGGGEAGPCTPIPTFPTGCFEAGLNACPDNTCVDFTEAGCPPIVMFSGNFPLQCERNSDCSGNGYCCAGQEFAGPLSATAGNRCAVDTTTDMFYARGTSCSASMCGSPVCQSDSDCRVGQHCAVMLLTDDPKGPAIGACVK
jgi:hypothetical protein